MQSSFLYSLGFSLSFTFISDLTDKSIFFIIFLSKRLPTLTLYIVSLSSILLMNYLSILLGFYLPKLISDIYMKLIAFILFTSFGILSLVESKKEEEKLNELIEFTKKDFNDSENDYSLMNEESETDIESNKEIRFPSILRSNSIELNNNNENNGKIIAIFLALDRYKY